MKKFEPIRCDYDGLVFRAVQNRAGVNVVPDSMMDCAKLWLGEKSNILSGGLEGNFDEVKFLFNRELTDEEYEILSDDALGD